MGRSHSSGSSSTFSGSSASSASTAWSKASGLSDVSETGTEVRYKSVPRMNGAQKFMAWTLGIKPNGKKHHRVRAEYIEYTGIDVDGRIVKWLENPQLSWASKGYYHHDEDQPRRPRSKASSRGSGHHRPQAPQGRPMPPPQMQPGRPMTGPGGGAGGSFMGGGPMRPGPTPGPPPGPGPMPGHAGPPPPQQHFQPGPPPMPHQGGPWAQAAQDESDYDDEDSWSSGYESDGDSQPYQPQDGNWGPPPPAGGFPGGPPPPPAGGFPGGPPPPPAGPQADNFGDGTAFIKIG
ncbi:hypothetical protein MKZ38_003575 [Zalerion maritima]|uniref:Uncharacterized protein n=1 Tax=Zalerion maritima TaxID=339359 RepID=A0AAD5RP19_9PEZI|nr:hypothetical protein MKZ38_003575 [Zalerion maritima]